MSAEVVAEEQISLAIEQACAAQRDWERLSPRQRLRPVRGLRHLLVQECDALCAAERRDLDKSAAEIIGGELLPLADACRFLERAAARILRPRRIARRLRPLLLLGQSDTVHRRPRGIIGIIGTWNYPLFLNGVQLIQALTAGNAVVWKPSEVAAHSAALLHELLCRAGFPMGLVQRLPATRSAGPVLIEAGIDHLVFTGAAETGRHIARRLGERLISSTLELSGCDAQVVLEDADVSLAAQAAWFGATLNAGQTCVAVRRALVQRSVYAAFCAALGERVACARPMRLALEGQAEQAERLVRAAIASGARLLGKEEGLSRADAGPVCLPCVVIDARPEMALCQEASFAPLLAVLPFDSVEDVPRLAAACPYRLAASVFTRTRARAEELAARLRTGMVTINEVIVPTAHPATPFGGQGASGWGVTQGEEGLLEMTVPQVVSQSRSRLRPHYDLSGGGGAWLEPVLRGLLEAAHAPTRWVRWRGLTRALRAWWRPRG